MTDQYCPCLVVKWILRNVCKYLLTFSQLSPLTSTSRTRKSSTYPDQVGQEDQLLPCDLAGVHQMSFNISNLIIFTVHRVEFMQREGRAFYLARFPFSFYTLLHLLVELRIKNKNAIRFKTGLLIQHDLKSIFIIRR